jgi:isocitrate dehydrogenase kinase/phosphatase
MSSQADHDGLARDGSAALLAAFDDYGEQFRGITRRARARFEQRDWHGMQHDAADRLDLYGRVIAGAVAALPAVLGAAVQDKRVWAAMRAAYSRRITGRPDIELAETFFNSITRRLFATVGVDPRIEFLLSASDPPSPPGRPAYATYPGNQPLPGLMKAVLTACSFSAPFEDLERDARRVTGAIERERRQLGKVSPIDAIEVVRSVFYRNKGAYLVGRIRTSDGLMPIALALHNGEHGLFVDAALFSADEVSIIFSFTHSYFHVEVARPGDLVAFLQSIMPGKPSAELYNAIGYNKHGKTELYRDLMRHIDQSADRLEPARGDRGMVMIVFTLPSFGVVFKVIRDQFAYPKTTTRREVMGRYQLVFKHDRAGRLVDAQEFEHLAFARERFADDLLAELTGDAAGSVTVRDGLVAIKHLYTERRLTPLNLYLREADAALARDAVLDYGQAVKDLAATNIFPGDMLLKNFGVTRHGRVVFYDYDEICLVTDCNFRDMPRAHDCDEEFGAEPWFYVGSNDIFPEEFLTFLGLEGELRETFLQAHGDLLTADYWRKLQARHRAGEVMEIIPYRQCRRLGLP